MLVGSYSEIFLPKAREVTKELSTRVALDFDIAGERRARKAVAIEKVEQEKNALRASELAAEYSEQQVLGRRKHPDLLCRRIDKDINPHIGNMKVEGVKPRHIDAILQSAVNCGAPTIASDALRWTKRILNYVIKRHALELDPAGAFDLPDVGRQESSHMCWLTRGELIHSSQATHTTKGFSRENELTMKLILCLCCRKMELRSVQWDEFDLDEVVWYLPTECAKNGDAISIPLPPPAIGWLRELRTIASSGSKRVSPV